MDKVFFLFISWNVLMSNASVLHSPPPAFASADQQTIFIRAFYLHGVTKKMGLREGVKKKVVTLLQPM